MMMNGYGKSDEPIVPQKATNKANAQTASAAESPEGRGSVKGKPREQTSTRAQDRSRLQHALKRIRKAIGRDRSMQLTGLWHHVYDAGRLREAYHGINPSGAPGIDGQTWEQYGENLEENLKRLSDSLRTGKYRARPVRRQYIPKADGRQRPIGVPALEDKIVQRAATEVLNEVYEREFKGFSYGFRPGRSQHRALDALYMGLMRKRVNWIVDADIRGFFDTIDHQWMLKFVAHRIGDKRVLRHIAKWLKAGVVEEEKLTRSEEGTPQGGSISPLLSNIYLHYVLDLWVGQWRKRSARGEVIIVRYADDFVMGFEHKEEAERFLKELKERLTKFNLNLHPEKTRLIEFGRNAARQRKARGEGKPETFNFLGFTHICDKTRKRGRFIVLRQTMRKRMQAKLLEIKEELRLRMHESVPATGRWLKAVVGGYYRYHAVPRNLPAMMSFYRQIGRLWAAALRRRSHKAKLDWRRMHTIINRWIPSPHITHPYPEHRFGVTT
jgi:RNA-directed DNA polymerase